MAAPQHSQQTEGEGTAAPWTPPPPAPAPATPVASPSQIPVAVLASAPPAATAFPATRYPAIPNNRRTSSSTSASASPYPARSRIATTTAQPAQSIPASTSALLTAAQALAQQPASSSSNATPSLYGFPSLTSPVTTNNPSTRILSSANISTPVPSSASSSATFLTGRSQPGPSTTQTAAAAAAIAPRYTSSAAPAFNPWAVYNNRQALQQLAANNNNNNNNNNGNGGTNTPSRIGHGSLSLMQGVPVPLSFNSVTGSPRMHSSAQHHTGIYTAPQQSFPSAAAVAAAAANGQHHHHHHHHHQAGSRGSPTPRTLNIGGSALNPAMVGGLPGSTTSPPSGFPAWYRHPTSGLLPLLEVPAAFLSSGGSAGSSARPSAHHGRTGSTSALLRSSAALSLGVGVGGGRRPSSAGPNSSTTPTNGGGGGGGGGGTPTPPSAATPNPLHAGPIAGGAMAEDTLVSFSWVIGELALLRDEVERTMPPGDEGRSVSAGAGRNPVWTTQPCFGDPK
ncbi:unnamed protein product, partial [Tilletia controversa]